MCTLPGSGVGILGRDPVKFAAPAERIDYAKSHKYVDANGHRIPGVTSLIGDALAKPALINWAANATADYAVNRWDELAELPVAARLKELQGARYAEKDAAANRGTEIHRLGEALVKGEAVEVPPELHGYIEGYCQLLDDYKVEPVEVEFGCVNYTVGYAGSGDLIADVVLPRLGRKRLLIDLKSNKSGIFAETALQLAAYRYAEFLLADGDRPERPMIEVDGCAGIHVTPTGSHLIPITADENVFLTFRYVARVAAFAKDGKGLIGEAFKPEQESRFRLVREDAS